MEIALIEKVIYLEKTYRDGETSKYTLIEKPSRKGRKFVKAKNKSGDYYLITKRGNLQIWSEDYDGKYVLVVESKPIK